MNIKVIGDLREYDAGALPRVLLRVVLEFAGSLINKRHRMHRFLQLELGIYKIMHVTTITPSTLQSFYDYHGRNVLVDLIRQAVRAYDADNNLEITRSMLSICFSSSSWGYRAPKGTRRQHATCIAKWRSRSASRGRGVA